MRFMVIVKASKDTEAGVMPSTKLLTGDGKVQRGTGQGRRDGGGRGPASERQGRADQVLRRQTDVSHGPFATKDLIAGFWLMQGQSLG